MRLADGRPRHAGRREGEDRETLFHQRDGAVQKIGGRKALGHHVAGLHQLQRHFEGVGVIQAAADHHGMAHEAVALAERVDLRLQRERGVDDLGNALQVGDAHRRPPSA